MLSTHSRPQSPRSFWPVAGIESSGLVQHRKSTIHGLPVKSGKSDWLRIRNEYSAHTQKIGSSQSSRSLPQARRIVGSGDENAIHCSSIYHVILWTINKDDSALYVRCSKVEVFRRNFPHKITEPRMDSHVGGPL